MPSSRPRIVIAEDGYCNGCTYNKTKRENIDWDLRKKELKHILDKSKDENSNTVYDCVIGWSGGKDSSAVALMLKKELGLNPLLVTFSPLIPTVEGEFNRRSLQFHGFDSIYCGVRPKNVIFLIEKPKNCQANNQRYLGAVNWPIKHFY